MVEKNAKNAVVTGGTRGIGLAITLELLKSGMDVFICGIEKEDPPSVYEPYLSSGRLIYHRCDLSVSSELMGFVKEIKNRFSTVDVLVNNAGETAAAGFLETSLSLWDLIQKTNVTAPFLLMQAFVPRMVEQKFGRIINISSISGKMGRSGRAAYAASKHALIGLSRVVAYENGAHGVTVNCICPGATDTDALKTLKETAPEMVAGVMAQMPTGRLVDPEQIAEMVRFLVFSDSSSLTGQTLVIDGGFYQN